LWDVCGVRCGALSVWHVYALCETGNPYLVGGTRDIDAAASLLLFASLDHAGGARLFAGDKYRAKSLRRIARQMARHKWADIDAACLDYVQTCRRVPQHKDPPTVPGKPSTSRCIAAPMPWVLVAHFGAAGNYEAAWNMPYAHARCMFDARRDASGDDETLESREEEARYDAMLATKGGE
jgi:hypothetical protein